MKLSQGDSSSIVLREAKIDSQRKACNFVETTDNISSEAHKTD